MEMVFLEKATDAAQMAIGHTVLVMPRPLYVVIRKRKALSRKHALAVFPPNNLFVTMVETQLVVRMVAGLVLLTRKKMSTYVVEKRLRNH